MPGELPTIEIQHHLHRTILNLYLLHVLCVLHVYDMCTHAFGVLVHVVYGGSRSKSGVLSLSLPTFKCMGVLPAHMSAFHACSACKEGVESSGTGVPEGCDMSVMWVLRTKPELSVRTDSALNHRAICCFLRQGSYYVALAGLELTM